MKKPVLFSYIFGVVSILLMTIALAGIYLPLHFSTPFLQSVRELSSYWAGLVFVVPVVSLVGIILCHVERKRKQGGTVVWWVNRIVCWGLLIWSLCMVVLGSFLGILLKNWNI